MKCLEQQEEEAKSGSKELSCIVYKGHMKAHSKFLDKLSGHFEDSVDEVDLNKSCKSGNNRSAL